MEWPGVAGATRLWPGAQRRSRRSSLPNVPALTEAGRLPSLHSALKH